MEVIIVVFFYLAGCKTGWHWHTGTVKLTFGFNKRAINFSTNYWLNSLTLVCTFLRGKIYTLGPKSLLMNETDIILSSSQQFQFLNHWKNSNPVWCVHFKHRIQGCCWSEFVIVCYMLLLSIAGCFYYCYQCIRNQKFAWIKMEWTQVYWVILCSAAVLEVKRRK